MPRISNLRRTALIAALVLGIVGLGSALYELLSPASGTTGTLGAILVTVSTALLAVGAALLVFGSMPGWIVGVLLALFIIDAAATAAAGYFLMAPLLVATMLAAFLAALAAAMAGVEPDEVEA